MRFYYCLTILFIFFSCQSKKEKPSLEKVWIYDDEQTQEEQVENIYHYGGKMEYNFSVASFMDLQQDGKFTSNFTAFDHGTWELQDSTLTLVNQNKIRLALDVRHLDNDQMVCLNRKNHKVYRFNGFANSFSSEGESSFSIANNQWRVKAKQKESDTEIAARLKNHFKFWEKYFQWGLNSKLKVLDIVSTPSLLDMYANGFKLKYYDRQSPDWQNIFYDSSNCWRAYEMVYYLMYKNEIKWPKIENRFEKYVSAFKQMQQWMDADPKTYLPDSANKSKIKKD